MSMIERLPHRDSLILLKEPSMSLLHRSELLTPEQCDEILKIDSSVFAPGVVTYDGVTHVVNNRRRIVKAGWVHREGYEWLYTIIREKAAELNSSIFNVNIIGILDSISFMRYEADESGENNHGKFDWHSDIGEGYTSMRKLSIIIGLTDPEEYEGGELKLFMNGQYNAGKLKKGEFVIFPSFVQHCVTPVTKGVRQSLVAFISGPRYR
jgi:PKHD-type hydroxylase